MSVSNRKRDQKSALETLVRTFFQRYDDGAGAAPDHMSVLRSLPLGSVAAFFSEQALWRAQRALFGITLVELKRLSDLAREEAQTLRAEAERLQGEVTFVRAELRAREA